MEFCMCTTRRQDAKSTTCRRARSKSMPRSLLRTAETIATSGDDETIRRLDAVDGKPRLRISGPKGRHAFSVLFTPSGGQIVTTWNDPVIRIFNTQTGALEGELKDSKDTVNQIALAPDGKTLASGSDDGAARLW